MTRGMLGLVGGAEFQAGNFFDEQFIKAADAEEVLVLPTAAAYLDRSQIQKQAQEWFYNFGAQAKVLDVYSRADALSADNAAVVREARMIYVVGGSPMHLRSVMMRSAVWDALEAAWADGATLVGSGAGSDVMFDAMVDPRGGAFTLGLGLLHNLTFIPRYNLWSRDKVRRTVQLASPDLPVVGVAQQAALIAEISEGEIAWSTVGQAEVVVFLNGKPADLSVLPDLEQLLD